MAMNRSLISQLKALRAHASSRRCLAERAFLRQWKGVCSVRFGVNTSFEGEQLVLTGHGGQPRWPAPDPCQGSRAATNQKRSGRPGQSALRLPEQERSWRTSLPPFGPRSTEEGWRGGCRGPCSGSAQAALFQWNLLGFGGSRGGSQRCCRGGFHVLLGFTNRFPVRRPGSEGLMGAWWRTLGSQAGPPLRVFSPDPEASTATPSVYCRFGLRWDSAFLAPPPAPLAEPAVPALNWLSCVAVVGWAPMLGGCGLFGFGGLRQRAKGPGSGLPSLMAMADGWCRRHRSCRFCGW